MNFKSQHKTTTRVFQFSESCQCVRIRSAMPWYTCAIHCDARRRWLVVAGGIFHTHPQDKTFLLLLLLLILLNWNLLDKTEEFLSRLTSAEGKNRKNLGSSWITPVWCAITRRAIKTEQEEKKTRKLRQLVFFSSSSSSWLWLWLSVCPITANSHTQRSDYSLRGRPGQTLIFGMDFLLLSPCAMRALRCCHHGRI